MKRALIGVGLIIAAILVWLALRPSAPNEHEAPKPKAEKAEIRTNPALTNSGIVLPSEDELDEEEEPTPQPTRKRGHSKGWDCAGELPVAEIRPVIAQNERAIRSCYEKALRTNNTLSGQLLLQLRVDASGRVSETRTGGSLRSPEVNRCVRKVAKQLTFPRIPSGDCAVIAAPFSFEPKS